MKQKLLTIVYLFLFSGVSNAQVDIDAAVADICNCGFSGQCMDSLPEKYPEIDKSTELQNLVMSKAMEECGPGSKSTADSIKSLTGNQNLDLSKILGESASALAGINNIVSVTDDCSTVSFTVAIPDDWQCRKMADNSPDVTVSNKGRQIDVSVGVSQGKTSCSILPNCISEAYALSEYFDSTLFKNPMIGTYEYAGTYKKDNQFKLTITSTKEPTADQLVDIKKILDSFNLR